MKYPPLTLSLSLAGERGKTHYGVLTDKENKHCQTDKQDPR
jgi:hypothetical protein